MAGKGLRMTSIATFEFWSFVLELPAGVYFAYLKSAPYQPVIKITMVRVD